MNKQIKKFIIKVLASFRRIGLKNKDFSIISNNCWGGIMSRDFGLPYNSPTCGAFFFSKEYLSFCQDLKASLSAELQELKVENSKYKDHLDKYGKELILGKVLESEIVFLHYKTFEEAKAKWDRRKARINWDNLIVKYNDQNLFSEEDFYVFQQLPYKNKLFFTGNKKFAAEKNTYFLECFEKDGYAVDDIKPSRKYFNLKKYLNEMIKN